MFSWAAASSASALACHSAAMTACPAHAGFRRAARAPPGRAFVAGAEAHEDLLQLIGGGCVTNHSRIRPSARRTWRPNPARQSIQGCGSVVLV